MAKKEREFFKDEIIKLFKSGLVLTKIAEKLNINRLDVKIILKENNLYTPPKRADIHNNDIHQQIIKLYKEGKNFEYIEKKLDFPRKTISKILKENNIEIRKAKFYNKKYSVRENAFSILTPESCYWAGFIAGDGCVYSHGLKKGDKTNNYLTIGLQYKDKNHLENFKDFINYSGVIYEKKDKKSAAISINSLNIVKDLEKNFNIRNNKSYNYIPPNLPDEMKKYFILGMIDADGSFIRHLKTHLSKNRFRGDYNYQIGFTGTLESCLYIKDYFKVGPKIHTRHKDRDNNNFTLLIQGNLQCLKIGNIIYDEKSVKFCLKRKLNNYKALKEEYKKVALYSNVY